MKNLLFFIFLTLCTMALSIPLEIYLRSTGQQVFYGLSTAMANIWFANRVYPKRK